MHLKKFFKSNVLFFLIFFCLIFSQVFLIAGELKEGQSYSGFKLLKTKQVKELNGIGFLFLHQKSGARLLKILTRDDNNLFAIGFKTPQSTDKGIPHILEHSVLNGSKKFPVKSPFDVLKKGSLHTFLNAVTDDDNTVYPAASRNDKDFFNLMDVYLDAVLFPRIYEEPRILKREGWHYQLDSNEAELKINGIVYNEMKGYYSNPMLLANFYVNKNLFPDTCYGNDPGGYPPEIPNLSPEEFLNFHKKFYHPSNSYIYLEGDGDILKELEFIDKNYLSRFVKQTADSFIPLQKPFFKRKVVVAHYPISEKDDESGKTWLGLSFVAGQAVQRDVSMALDVLSDVLMNLPAAPLRRALLDAGIGKDMFSNFTMNKQNRFDLVVKNANLSDKDKFEKIVVEGLQKLAEKGINKRMIRGVINRLEFTLREGPRSWAPKPLINFYSALDTWLYQDDPFPGLEYEKPLAILKKGLKTDYFEKIIDKYLLKNPHSLLMVMKPRKGLVAEQDQKLKKKLSAFKTSLSEEKLEELVTLTKSLKEYQDSPDTPEALETIPLLSLKDVNPRAEKYEVKVKSEAGLKVLSFPVFTSNIVYLRLLFDCSVIPQELISYAPLLAALLGELNTQNYNYGDLDTEINLHTGGIFIGVNQYVANHSEKTFLPKFVVSGKVMPDKFPQLVRLIGEIVKNSRFDDKKRLKELLLQHHSRLQSRLNRAGHIYAYRRMASYLNHYRKYQELTSGLSYNKFVARLVADFEGNADEIIDNLKKITSLIFNRLNLLVGLVCSHDNYRQVKDELTGLSDYLGNKTPLSRDYQFSFKEKNEGLLSPSQVQYVFQGYNFKDLGYTYSGKMQVLAQVLRRGYLQKEIRIKGGAYGRFAQFSRFGMGFFGSYRDPHLEGTLKVFQGVPEHLKDFQANEKEMIRYILGTITVMDTLLEPEEKGDLAISRYIQKISFADVQKTRDDILGTTVEDIRGFAKMIAEMLAKSNFCVFGNEKKLEENKKLFNKLIKTTE